MRTSSGLKMPPSDPVASVYGAFGKFLSANGLQLGDITRVMITGVGASFVTERLYGIPTGKVGEFQAIGLGGLFLSELPKAIVVSMGTGTAIVVADGEGVRHIGGTGVGGGTLLGLSKRMLGVRDFRSLIEAADGGNLANIDLAIGDITRDPIVGLPADATASNFGKISDLASPADVALGIINLVCQAIGRMAVFAARMTDTKDVVLTGNLTSIPQAAGIFEHLGDMFDTRFHVPEAAQYATAAGAAITLSREMPFTEIG